MKQAAHKNAHSARGAKAPEAATLAKPAAAAPATEHGYLGGAPEGPVDKGHGTLGGFPLTKPAHLLRSKPEPKKAMPEETSSTTRKITADPGPGIHVEETRTETPAPAEHQVQTETKTETPAGTTVEKSSETKTEK